MSVCVLGSINLDVVATVEALPRPGETVIAQHMTQFPGGKGANQAVAAARMDADTRMIGAVGTDDPGSQLLAFLGKSGVDVVGIQSKRDQPTGQAYINVADSGENSIVVVPGANRVIAPEDIGTELLADRTIFLAQLEIPITTIADVFGRDAPKNGMTILNAAPAHADGRDLFELVDVLIVNETELALFARLGDEPQSERDIVDAARRLISRDRQSVIVTLGKSGSILIDRTEIFRARAPSVNVVDTTGAGDCFCGVIAAALSEGRPLTEAMVWANSAASLSVQTPGAAPSMPSRAQVEALL